MRNAVRCWFVRSLGAEGGGHCGAFSTTRSSLPVGIAIISFTVAVVVCEKFWPKCLSVRRRPTPIPDLSLPLIPASEGSLVMAFFPAKYILDRRSWHDRERAESPFQTRGRHAIRGRRRRRQSNYSGESPLQFPPRPPRLPPS